MLYSESLTHQRPRKPHQMQGTTLSLINSALGYRHYHEIPRGHIVLISTFEKLVSFKPAPHASQDVKRFPSNPSHLFRPSLKKRGRKLMKLCDDLATSPHKPEHTLSKSLPVHNAARRDQRWPDRSRRDERTSGEGEPHKWKGIQKLGDY